MTSDHVVAGARGLFVQLDAGDPVQARVVGTAPDYDLAVVRGERERYIKVQGIDLAR